MNKLIRWFTKKDRQINKYKYAFVSEVPDRLDEKTIYIETNLDVPWQIVMRCPCGCRKNLHMNLLSEYYPYWKYSISKKNRISLFPSIHRFVGCRSHFFIKKGEILWCK